MAISPDEVFEKLFPKVASDLPDLRQQAEEARKLAGLRIEVNKLAAMEGDMRSMAVGADIRRDKEEDEFYGVVRTMLLEGKSFDEIYENLAMDQDEMGNTVANKTEVRSMLRRIMDRLKAENLIDAAEELPDDTPMMSAADRTDTAPDYKAACDRFTAVVKLGCEVQTMRYALDGVREELQAKQDEFTAQKKSMGRR